MALQPVMEDPQEQSQDSAQGGAPGGAFEQMVTSVSSNLMQIQKLFAGEGVPEELTSKLADLNDQYKAVLHEVMSALGGGQQGPPKPAGRGPSMVDSQGGITGVPV